MFIWLFIIVSAIWVLIDAKKIGVKMGNIGPWGWFFVTLLLWIVGFPMYLYYRGKFYRAVAASSTASATVPISGAVNTSSEKGGLINSKMYSCPKCKNPFNTGTSTNQLTCPNCGVLLDRDNPFIA